MLTADWNLFTDNLWTKLKCGDYSFKPTIGFVGSFLFESQCVYF